MLVQSYWEIGQEIHKACGENDRVEYGKKLLEYLSEHLTNEFGKGFTVANLKNMTQFYRTFPIRQTLPSELSWPHYNLIMRIEDEKSKQSPIKIISRVNKLTCLLLVLFLLEILW